MANGTDVKVWRRPENVGVCYLCGDALDSDVSNDHVPPKQIFPASVRKAVNFDQLITLPTHLKCNQEYALDEEYFAATLAPIASESPAGAAFVADFAKAFRRGKSVPLGEKILRQMEERPSGLHLPGDRVIMRVEGERIGRVVWKIVRVFYFLEYSEVLPDNTAWAMELIEPLNPGRARNAEIWAHVKAQPSRCSYGAVFDCKYLLAESGKMRLHAWGMLFWDKVMVFVKHFPVGEEPE